MNGSAGCGDLFSMSGDCIPDPYPNNLAHRYDTARGWFVDALSLAAAAVAVFHYNPTGVIATVMVLIGAYAVGNFLGQVLWRTSLTWLLLVTMLIYVSTFFYASSHLPLLPALLLTLFLPGFAQAYVIWDLWPATGSLLHPITLFCVAWLVLLAICIFEPTTFGRLTSFIKARRGCS
ncbi:hypothetical protein [Tardiphaga sp. 768_D3_N2_1]|uniref:hypothetical protein n=1 Tax=Tardiphaga sp. 768_D3_N2_1 TaxID=3240783 RepID=UPI003F8BDE49